MIEVVSHKTPVAERIAVIEEYNELLAQQPMVRSFAALANAEFPIDTDALNAAIMGTGIAGFDVSMSKRSKRIVKNTFMYADLMSLLRFPAKSQREQRFGEFMRLMTVVGGWQVYSAPYTKYAATSRTLTMDNVALGIINTAATALISKTAGLAKVLSKVADTTMETLKTAPQALTLFERNVKNGEGGNFSVTSSTEDADGGINLAVAAVQYFTKAPKTSVLFAEWSSSDTEIYKGAASMYMDEEDYLVAEADIVKALAAQRQKALTLEFGAA